MTHGGPNVIQTTPFHRVTALFAATRSLLAWTYFHFHAVIARLGVTRFYLETRL